MQKVFSRKPYFITLVTVGVLTLFEILMYARTVFGQGAALLFEDSGFDTVVKVAGFITVCITLLTLVSGIVWYVFKGKSNEQQKATIADLEANNRELRAANSDLKLEKADHLAEIKNLENINENLRKANLRLQGINEK